MGVGIEATVMHGFSQEEIAEAVKATFSPLGIHPTQPRDL